MKFKDDELPISWTSVLVFIFGVIIGVRLELILNWMVGG